MGQRKASNTLEETNSHHGFSHASRELLSVLSAHTFSRHYRPGLAVVVIACIPHKSVEPEYPDQSFQKSRIPGYTHRSPESLPSTGSAETSSDIRYCVEQMPHCK